MPLLWRYSEVPTANFSYMNHSLTTVVHAGHGLLLAVLLSATYGCGEKSDETANQMGRNFLEELFGQVGIRPRSEALGLSGSAALQLESTIESCYANFVDKLASLKLRIIPARNIISNPLYQELLASQTDDTAKLFRYLGRDVLTLRLGENNRIHLTQSRVLAVITFAAYNGDLGLALGTPGLGLLNLKEDRLPSLAKSLGADYLVAVTLVPRIKKFDPMGKLGTVSVSYRIRVFNQHGKVVIDEPVVGDLSQPQDAIQFIGIEIPFVERGKMGFSKVFFAFPTEDQKQRLVQIEKRLMSEVFAELPGNLLQHINE